MLEQVHDGIVVVIGAHEDAFGEVGRFRQKNDFMYLTGSETPSAYLILIPAGLIPGKTAVEETLYIPARNLFQEKWTGAQVGPGSEGQEKFGIARVDNSDKFYSELLEILSNAPFKSGRGYAQGAKLYTVVPEGSAATLTRESQFINLIRTIAPQVQVADLSPVVDEMRKVKSPTELKLLQKAIDITAEAQADGARTIRPGIREYVVQAAIEAAFTRNGSERPGYPSIVGSGIYSTVLHYNENKKVIESGDLVVCDVGAEYSFYTADITRTFPASGKFTDRQRQVYQLVLDAQRAAEKAYKPGESTIRDLQTVAFNVMKSSPLRDKDGNTLERYFIHGLGHWLGMDVHDVGSYNKPIPVGAVFTIEPGIYIPDEKLGVRIEDNYLATETGLVKLSAKLPCEPDEVEQMMSARASSRPMK